MRRLLRHSIMLGIALSAIFCVAALVAWPGSYSQGVHATRGTVRTPGRYGDELGRWDVFIAAGRVRVLWDAYDLGQVSRRMSREPRRFQIARTDVWKSPPWSYFTFSYVNNPIPADAYRISGGQGAWQGLGVHCEWYVSDGLPPATPPLPGMPGQMGIYRASHSVTVPLSFIATLSGIAPVTWLIRVRRRKIRRERIANARCVKCGYDLRESPERCPECGTAITTQRDAA